jgi:hypothetical protein
MRLTCLEATHYYDLCSGTATEEAKASVQLAAAAPTLVRELLMVEWSGERWGSENGEVVIDSVCPRCWERQESGHGQMWDETLKANILCTLDAALSAAGSKEFPLETQEQRNEARRMIGAVD